jgi:hypothetical protein
MDIDKIAPFDPRAYALAQQRVKYSPQHLTDDDFLQLGIISERLEEDARFAQKSAQLAMQKAAVTPVVAPVLETKHAAVTVEPDSMKAWLQKYGKHAATCESLSAATDVIFGVLEKNFGIVRARIEALDQRIREQDTRILELEASAAARSKVHV